MGSDAAQPLEGRSLVPLANGDAETQAAFEARHHAFGRPLYGLERWGVIAGDKKWSTHEGKELLFDKASGRLLGAGIVGPNAGDLIAETALAIELGCDAADIGLTIHPHPTLSEVFMEACEDVHGLSPHAMAKKKK